ncbi:MAG: glycerophosphodiester phosphodiesterase family protein [Candidatus Thorarchaeota archaeon]
MFEESRGRRWVLLYSVQLLFVLIFVSVALLLEGYWISINDYLGSMTGINVNYVFGIIGITFLPITYTLFMFLRGVAHLLTNRRERPRLISKILSFVITATYVLLLIALLLLWGDDGVLVLEALEFLSLFIHLCIQAAAIAASIYLVPHAVRLARKIRQAGEIQSMKGPIVLGSFLLLYFVMFSSPLVIVPSNVVEGSFPPRPQVIGHRCGAALGPENTLETAATAVLHGVAGIEVDVQVSLDGIPFLMHDVTLERTTNIEEVFSGRTTELASFFIISELRQLDAGSWFVDSDPFGTIADGTLTTSQISSYQNESIPTLYEILDFVKQENLILNVDFREPPIDHPHHADYFNICLSTLQSEDIDSQIWVTSRSTSWLDITMTLAPEMITALTIELSDVPSSATFLSNGYDMLNAYHGLHRSQLLDYHSSGISLNTWVVNAAFRYTQLWCQGVDFVTTDYPHVLGAIVQPFWWLSIEVYSSIWIASTICLSLVVLKKLLDT